MAVDLWGLEDLQTKQNWLRNKMSEYRRIDEAYGDIQEQKRIYEDEVQNARKDIFKDGWFKGKYDWKGSNYSSFETFGKDDVKTAVDNYYRNGVNGLDDVADALLEARADIWNEIENMFFPKFGPLKFLDELFDKLSVEIASLLN